jgi:hypothetical protein
MGVVMPKNERTKERTRAVMAVATARVTLLSNGSWHYDDGDARENGLSLAMVDVMLTRLLEVNLNAGRVKG